MQSISTGLDRLRDEYWPQLKGMKLGLLANQASVDRHLSPAKDIIAGLLPGHLKVLFGPQHGYGGEDQDNMVETPHSYDRDLNIPVYSLYGDTRNPLPDMLDELDLLVIDLQDVGSRVYTFASTMLNCLRAAADQGKEVLLLDRPNPLGGKVIEGNLLRPEFSSFVGPYPLPMRHGLTMGELAEMFNDVFQLECCLKVLTMHGWRREMVWRDTGLRWVMPSPNMPLPDTAFVYPGQVIWEGTNISEGRGTCRPFEIFGAPFLDTGAIMQALVPEAKRGCILQEYTFRPTFQKWSGELCRGFMLHVLDPDSYRPFFSSLALLKAVLEIHQDSFQWKDPPYEYEYEKMPFDIILGDPTIRRDLERGVSLYRMQEKWEADLEAFSHWRKAYLLY